VWWAWRRAGIDHTPDAPGETERVQALGGKKTALFEPFIYKMHYFTKTGSGQT
jgi:hypothetical protein